MVTVAAFDNVLEAGYWRGLLEAQGIPVVLVDQEIVAAKWMIAGAVGNIKLQVPETMAPHAAALVDTVRRERPCQPPEESDARRALRIAFLGILCAPLQVGALWLVVRLLGRRRDLDFDDWRRVAVASLLCLWLPLGLPLWVAMFVRS